jgi:predicted 3-demethylubiquinone-9 3-methyltransferase (glyoxalase superfamily)
VDYYWDKLSLGGDETAQQCGWLKDRYGVSWQIIPRIVVLKDDAGFVLTLSQLPIERLIFPSGFHIGSILASF